MASEYRAGDANRITREYFDSLLLEMRHIDGELPNTTLQVYGETFATPIMTAALSHLDKVWPKGMIEMARGAHQSCAVTWAGMGDDQELEEMIATGARVIKIVKPYADDAEILRKLEHAENAGAFAVGMDLDHSFNGKGEYDDVLGFSMRPKTLRQVEQFVRQTTLPFIIKGVLSVTDAKKCMDAGVQGIVVSHHHGILDYAVPPAMVLPDIADVVDGQFPIFLDCGVESGVDVFKALALGADAVCVGRALMGPLKERGAAGVREMFQTMNAELKGAMARTCCRSLGEIDSSLVWSR